MPTETIGLFSDAKNNILIVAGRSAWRAAACGRSLLDLLDKSMVISHE